MSKVHHYHYHGDFVVVDEDNLFIQRHSNIYWTFYTIYEYITSNYTIKKKTYKKSKVGSKIYLNFTKDFCWCWAYLIEKLN